MGNKTWLTGESLTWLDFMWFELIDNLHYLSNGSLFQNYPTLEAYHYRFITMPGFAEVWADDSKTMKWPWNGDSAKIGGRYSD